MSRKNKLYPVESERYGDGHRMVHRFICTSCQETETIAAADSTPLPPHAVEKKFATKGWEIRGNKKLCPICVAEIDEKRRIPTLVPAPALVLSSSPTARTAEETSMTAKPEIIAPSPPVVADPPRQIDRVSRQIISKKLEDVYINERVGYSADWNDAVVAKDLGVPRAWVAEVREYLYGPETSVVQLETILGKIKEARAEQNAIITSFENLKKHIGDLQQEFSSLGNRMTANNALIEKLEKSEMKIAALLR